MVELSVLAFFVVTGVIVWLLAPLWTRPHVEPPPIPPASIAGSVDLSPRRRRQPLTSGEGIRVSVGIAFAIFAVLAVVAYGFATADYRH